MDDSTRQVQKSIPRSLWRQARAQAILEDKTVTQWIAEAIEDKLKRTKKKEE